MTQRNRTVNLNNVRVKGTLTFATNLQDFPLYPEVGETALVQGALYIFTTLDGIKTWYQLTEKRDTYFHIQNTSNRKWIVNHNFNTDSNSFFVYVEDSLEKDYLVSYSDNRVIELTFKTPVKGTVTVFKYPEINTLDITAETGNIKKQLKWKSSFPNVSKLPNPAEHSGMVTLTVDNNTLHYSNGKEWNKVFSVDNTQELESKILDKIITRFNQISYNNLLDKPDLNNLSVDWKNVQNKPALTDDYNYLKNTPTLVYSNEIEVFVQSRLRYDFQDENGQNLFINSSWLQVFIDGRLVSPSLYSSTQNEIVFENGLELGSIIQIVTIR